MTKVDRALELQVIDWLQWSEFPDNHSDNLPELALWMLNKRKLRNKELSMIIRRLHRKALRDKICSNCYDLVQLCKKTEHLLEPAEILRKNETGFQPVENK